MCCAFSCCLEGHGHSEGDRVPIDDFRHYSRDVFAHVDRIKVDFPTLPVFIVGHSMVRICYTLDRNVVFTIFLK